jgi:hypothetical protein
LDQRDELTEGWRKVHNEELHSLSRRMRWAGHVARVGEKRNAYRILVGKPEDKETTGKT